MLSKAYCELVHCLLCFLFFINFWILIAVINITWWRHRCIICEILVKNEINIFTKKSGCDIEYIQVGKTMEEQRVYYMQIFMNLSK